MPRKRIVLHNADFIAFNKSLLSYMLKKHSYNRKPGIKRLNLVCNPQKFRRLHAGLIKSRSVIVVNAKNSVADFFVDGAVGIAARFGIPQLVIGLTIAAMGTSMPEAAVSITSALKGSAGITVGNVVGSNIINILIILGVTAIIAPIAVQKSTRNFEIPGMIAITVLFLMLGYTGGEIVRFEGIILWVVFIGYLVYLFWIAKHNKDEEIDDEHEKNMTWQPLYKSGYIKKTLRLSVKAKGQTNSANMSWATGRTGRKSIISTKKANTVRNSRAKYKRYSLSLVF